MTEKRIIPITFSNEKLHSIIDEIIEYNNELGNFEFQITDKKNLEQNNKHILVTDDKFFFDNQDVVLKFDLLFIINSNSNELPKSNSDCDIISINIPLRISDLFQRVSNSLVQLEIQTSRKLIFRNLIYDPGMRILSNDNSSVRLTEKESQIFNCLIDFESKHISKKSLLKKVWSYNENIDTHTLETHIYSLRKKIEKNLSLKDLIIFVENKGYVLNKEIL